MKSLIYQPDLLGLLSRDPQMALAYGAVLLVMSLLLALLAIRDYRRKRRYQRLIQDSNQFVMLTHARSIGKRRAAEREWGRAAEDVQ